MFEGVNYSPIEKPNTDIQSEIDSLIMISTIRYRLRCFCTFDFIIEYIGEKTRTEIEDVNKAQFRFTMCLKLLTFLEQLV